MDRRLRSRPKRSDSEGANASTPVSADDLRPLLVVFRTAYVATGLLRAEVAKVRATLQRELSCGQGVNGPGVLPRVAIGRPIPCTRTYTRTVTLRESRRERSVSSGASLQRASPERRGGGVLTPRWRRCSMTRPESSRQYSSHGCLGSILGGGAEYPDATACLDCRRVPVPESSNASYPTLRLDAWEKRGKRKTRALSSLGQPPSAPTPRCCLRASRCCSRRECRSGAPKTAPPFHCRAPSSSPDPRASLEPAPRRAGSLSFRRPTPRTRACVSVLAQGGSTLRGQRTHRESLPTLPRDSLDPQDPHDPPAPGQAVAFRSRSLPCTLAPAPGGCAPGHGRQAGRHRVLEPRSLARRCVLRKVPTPATDNGVQEPLLRPLLLPANSRVDTLSPDCGRSIDQARLWWTGAAPRTGVGSGYDCARRVADRGHSRPDETVRRRWQTPSLLAYRSHETINGLSLRKEDRSTDPVRSHSRRTVPSRSSTSIGSWLLPRLSLTLREVI